MIHFSKQRTNQRQADQPCYRLQQRHFAHQQDIRIHLGQNLLILILNVQFGQRLVRIDADLTQLTFPAGDVDPANVFARFTGKFFVGLPVFDAFGTGSIVLNVNFCIFLVHIDCLRLNGAVKIVFARQVDRLAPSVN